MKLAMLSSLAMAFSFFAMMPAQADTVQSTVSTTEYYQPAPLPHVVDSWMQPTVSRKTSVTTADGSTESVVEPLVQERHERVVIPTAETTTTTVVGHPRVVTETIHHVQTRTAVAKRVTHVAYKPVHHYVAHRYHTTRAIAYKPTVRRDDYVVRKTVTEEPQVIQQTQHTEQKSVIMDRRDPALDLY